MSSCDLGDYSRDYERYYIGFRKVSTRATCYDCGKVSRNNFSYPLFTTTEDEREIRVGTNYLCEDCHSLHHAFNISILGTARAKINQHFINCWQQDFDITLLDKLTTEAREYVLNLIHELQEEED